MYIKSILCAVIILSATIIFHNAVLSQENITPGQICHITCKENPAQSYTCYLPKAYNKTKKWPILYCFAPDGNGSAFVGLFSGICEKNGWIVVGSNNARNGPGDAIQAATEAMWKDTHARFSLSDKLCYSSGFSGGSGMAFGMAQTYPDNFAGVIPMAVATSWADETPDIPKHIAVYFIIGDRDAVHIVKKHAEVLKERGHKVEVKTFSGGHQMPPKQLADAAVEWLAKIAPKERPPRKEVKKDAKRAEESYQAALKAIEDKNYGLAVKKLFEALDYGERDSEVVKNAQKKMDEVQDEGRKQIKEAEELAAKNEIAKAKQILKKVMKDFEGTDVADEAEEKLKTI